MYISQKCCNFAVVIELDRHIEILLLSNDCVIVPGLGGFMTHHVEARYDENDHTFLPPQRTLGFNPQLTMNDSLLVQSYVEAYDMSYPEALRRIEDEVNELKQHLENEGQYDLNDIGVLSVNEDGKYIFSPCEAGILTPGLYGLSSYEMLPLSEIKTKEMKTQEQKEEKPVEVVEVAAETTIPVYTIGDTEVPEAESEVAAEEEEERAIVIKMSWIRNAVAVAAAVLTFFLMTTPVSNSESNLAISNLNSPMIAGMMPKDSNMEKIAIEKKVTVSVPDTTVLAKKEEPVAAKSDSIPVAQKTAEMPAKRYCIVLASYVTKKNAHLFVEELQKKGYKEAEVFIRNEVTRVIYGNFETANDAYNRLHSIQKQKGLEEAWVMKI